MAMQGKVALVTGAAKGLGKGFAESLLKRGAKVCLSDIDIDTGEKTTDSLQKDHGSHSAMFVKCDTSSRWDMEKLFDSVKQRYGQLDIVVNNAGLINELMWEKMLEVNLIGMIRGTQLGLRHMGKDQGGQGGQIINIASSAGFTCVPFMPAYCASKHGIVAYTRSWAMHPSLAQHGVRMNCLCPFFTKTSILNMKPEQCYDLDMAKDLFKKLGVMEISQVVDAFDSIVDDDSMNGAILQVSMKGHNLVKFPKTGYEGINKITGYEDL